MHIVMMSNKFIRVCGNIADYISLIIGKHLGMLVLYANNKCRLSGLESRCKVVEGVDARTITVLWPLLLCL